MKNKVSNVLLFFIGKFAVVFKFCKRQLKKVPFLYTFGIYIAFGVLIGVFLSNNVITKANVVGDSMIPTYYDGDTVVINRLAEIERGDLVVVKEEDDKYVIKRIVGMPKDTIQIKDGMVFIDGDFYKEDYINEGNKDYESGVAEDLLELGEDEYFMLGDNRSVSRDSRTIGPITKDQIVGKVVISL